MASLAIIRDLTLETSSGKEVFAIILLFRKYDKIERINQEERGRNHLDYQNWYLPKTYSFLKQKRLNQLLHADTLADSSYRSLKSKRLNESRVETDNQNNSFLNQTEKVINVEASP